MSPYYTNLRRQIGSELLLIPAVAAIIHDSNGRLLLQQKQDETWSLPAGAIEPGESPENAVRREVLEETGYAVSALTLAGVSGGREFRYTYANGHQVEYTVVLYYCVVQKIDSPLDPETRSIAYFSEGEMPHLAMPYPKELLFPPRMKP